jgi:R3H-associated N-terminal domain
MNNPWAQPPLPSDWHVMPTHPVRVVPYFLAPLWEERLAARREEERERRLKLQKQRNGYAKGSVDESSVVHVPKDLRSKMKRAKAAKGLLFDLEEDIRSFVAGWQANDGRERTVSFGSAVDVDEAICTDDSEDDIVFVGRNGKTHDDPPSPKVSKSREDMVLVDDMLAEKLVFGALADDKGAKFG